MRRAAQGDIVYPVVLCHAALSGKPLQLKKGERSYLMPPDDHSYVAHLLDVTALARAALKELQAWEPAAPAVQFAQPLSGGPDVIEARNVALYAKTQHGLEEWPLNRRINGMQQATRSSDIRTYAWEIRTLDDDLPMDPSIWIWPGETKGWYINSKPSFAWAFEQLGPQC